MKRRRKSARRRAREAIMGLRRPYVGGHYKFPSYDGRTPRDKIGLNATVFLSQEFLDDVAGDSSKAALIGDTLGKNIASLLEAGPPDVLRKNPNVPAQA
jgi:hypothetical protein